MNALRFYGPLWLILVPLFAGLLWWRFRAGAARGGVLERRRSQGPSCHAGAAARRGLKYLYALGLFLVILGLARPQAGKAESRIAGQGIAIEIVLDVSGSMEAIDFQLDGRDVSRLEAVKHVIQEFVLGSAQPDSRAALMTWSGWSHSVVSPTASARSPSITAPSSISWPGSRLPSRSATGRGE